MTKEFDKEFLEKLLEQAKKNPLLRQNYIVKEVNNNRSQRRVNALQPGTKVPIHRHPNASENVLCLQGKLDEVIYSVTPEPSESNIGTKYEVMEVARYHLCPREGNFGCVIPAGAWHTIEVSEPSAIYEAKDGRYKEDGTVYLEDFQNGVRSARPTQPWTRKLKSAFLSVLPEQYFTINVLPYWCLLFLDCSTIVLTGLLSVYLTLGGVETITTFWNYTYIWLFSLPIFLLTMNIFGSYRGVVRKATLTNFVSILCALLVGGIILMVLSELLPGSIIPFRPALRSTMLMILISTVMQTLYRTVAKRVFYVNPEGDLRTRNPFQPKSDIKGFTEDDVMAYRKRINLCLAHMSNEGLEQKYVTEAFETNWVVPLGPNVNAFEQSLKEYVLDVKEAPTECEVAALSAGTAAIHLALIACGVGPGDEVCVQSFTFCASSNPITYMGATPVFIDSEPETWNMDPKLLEEAIQDRIVKTGQKPKAIIPVSLYGMPYNADRIMEIAERYGIPVIEDAAEGFGSRFNGRVLGRFGRFGVLSFNGNKMITTSGGGALLCNSNITKVKGDEVVNVQTAKESKNNILWYATQAREAYPYYQHEAIGYNYRMSNICAGIGRGQMTVVDEHISHHKHVQTLYEQLLADVPGIKVHKAPNTLTADGKSQLYDSNYWLCTITLDPNLRIIGQENAYKQVIQGAVGGAAGVIHLVDCPTTDCQPNANVEALRVIMDKAQIEARPVWKPMHKQPVYREAPAYVNGVSEAIFKVGMCLPSGPYVSDDDVRYIVNTIRNAIAK